MSKAIPSWKVVFRLKPSTDGTPSVEHVKDWYSYSEGNPKEPPVPAVHLCGPIKIEDFLEFAVCLEEEAHNLALHMKKTGFVEDYSILRIKPYA